MTGPADPEAVARLLAEAQSPPREFGMMPFWFWNDDLDEGELLRQLQAFHAGGVGGVVIHPRTGLSPRVGYLTAEYFRLIRLVVEECARLGMKVVLYDEGGYPSGSACGGVVAADPEHAARALILLQRDIAGPFTGYWRPAAGRSLQQRLVCVVLAPAAGEGIDAGGLRLLEPDERGLVRLEVGAGDWRALACVDVPSGGTIRGVLAEHEDGAATAPPAGDILNPEAVASFLRLTHEAYAQHLGDHLGSTVVALFTDEPSPMGRGARRGARPFTPGFPEVLRQRLGRDVRAWLPALWVDYGPGTAEFRAAYADAVEARLRQVFYRAQSEWCARHGLALTGHPADSDDMASLRDFHWPGQDMVWRWVLPGDPSGRGGAHSTAPKAAASAARSRGRARAGSELFGAYGWGLTLDEAKWLLDWHLARGVDLFFPHAFFYSLRGGRAYESEPDVGLHNPFWPHFQHLAAYVHRLCWLLAMGRGPSAVAVLAEGRHLPWAAAQALLEGQLDFFYADAETDLSPYRTVVVGDGPAPTGAAARLASFGGAVVPAHPLESLTERVRAACGPAPQIHPPAPGLRVITLRPRGVQAHLLFNEGEQAVRGVFRPAWDGGGQWWDPLRGNCAPAEPAGEGIRLELPRRESRLLLRAEGAGAAPAPGRAEDIALPGPWEVADAAGTPLPIPGLGDFARLRALERFAGTVHYTARLNLPAAPVHCLLDLGGVGDAAAVLVNGNAAGFALWAPYTLPLPAGALRPGANTLEVAVTNSAANAYEGALRPSGLFGPVRLRCWWAD